MEIKNRLFTYPVLSLDTDDYIDSSFEVDYDIKDTTYDLTLNFDIKLNCESLETLIRSGFAEYVIHIECSSTAYRRAIKFETNQKSITIAKSKINGEISILAMVVAKKKIINYSSINLNEDYSDEYVNFEHASILAYQNLSKIIISKNYEELTKSESLFTVIQVKSENEEGYVPLRFENNDNKIKIIVDEKTYSAYLNFKQSKNVALSLLVLPALVFTIEGLQEDYDSFEHCDWLIKFEQFFKHQGKDFRNDLINSDMNIIEIAQEILNNPISKAYCELIVQEWLYEIIFYETKCNWSYKS